ncbi:MAG: cysteine desulfurase family protein [Candidatus Woesearchaeota archaeon]
MREIYLDHAATTPVEPKARAAMEKYWAEEFGNPGSLHSAGLRAQKALSASRAIVAKILNCAPEEVIFTGSGTESINMAIKGVFRANKAKGKHIITSATEHHAVLETCKYLHKHEGAELTILPVNKYGQVMPETLEKAIRPDTVLVTIQYANNEIGTINMIKELAAIAKKHNVLFHTDACQAAGSLDLDVNALGIDLLTLNGSKVYGPKGVGALYIRRGTNIHPILHGGGQEFGLRSGTENIPLIVGFATALEIAHQMREMESERLAKLRDKLISTILKTIPKTFLNGHPTERLPNNANITFVDIEGEALLLHLNEHGIYASTGSACSSKSLDPSHVILALGLPYEASHGSIRFTLGRHTTEEDINKVLDVLPGIVQKLRNISPVNLNMEEVLK